MKALLAGIFGAYADKREIQAVLAQPQLYDDYRQMEDIWIDYVADLGDGWDSTYAIAWLLAQRTLSLDLPDRDIKLPRGRILVMGGDQVYPAATREAYRDRMVGPYRSALPCLSQGESPHLFTIPGNHDWYDGLTSFSRLFCQGRWIGGWRTRQSRSYFAIKLPHNWWLWGVDIQLESDIDKPQLDYFEWVAQHHMRHGDRVILCTAIPSWLSAGSDVDPDSSSQETGPHHNLTYLVERYIHEYGGHVHLTLAGDLHHYCHYQDASGHRHKITSGGGGAFLHGTHGLPETLDLKEGGAQIPYGQTATFPSVTDSRRMVIQNFLFPVRNLPFVLFLGGFYLLIAWIIRSASKKHDQTFMEAIQNAPFNPDGIGAVLKQLYLVAAYSPATVVFFLILFVGCIAFCDPKPERRRWVRKTTRVAVGLTHGLLHASVSIGLMWGFAHLNLSRLGLGVDDFRHIVLFSAGMLILGGSFGALIMGVYLFLTNLALGFHQDTAFSSIQIQDYKNFLRLHIDKTGLTVYPVGIRKVPRTWTFMAQAVAGEPWFEPPGGRIEAHLIEEPLRIKPPS